MRDERTTQMTQGFAATARICVIINAGSGSQDRTRVQEISRALADRPWARCEIVVPPRPELLAEAARTAVAQGADTVVACGGDGTISAVAGALADTGARLGVVPQGTFNFFARGYGIPDQIGPAVEVIARGHTSPAAVGTVNGKVFVNNASLGVYPAILKQRETIYRRWGRSRLAAHWSLFKTMALFRRTLHLTIDIGGEVLHRRTPLAFVAMSAYQLELLGLDAAAHIRQGRLVLLLAPEDRPLAMMLRALRLGLGLAVEQRDYEVMAADHFRIETRRPTQMIARDGERDVLVGPLEFRMHRAALRVLVPETPA